MKSWWTWAVNCSEYCTVEKKCCTHFSQHFFNSGVQKTLFFMRQQPQAEIVVHCSLYSMCSLVWSSRHCLAHTVKIRKLLTGFCLHKCVVNSKCTLLSNLFTALRLHGHLCQTNQSIAQILYSLFCLPNTTQHRCCRDRRSGPWSDCIFRPQRHLFNPLCVPLLSLRSPQCPYSSVFQGETSCTEAQVMANSSKAETPAAWIKNDTLIFMLNMLQMTDVFFYRGLASN